MTDTDLQREALAFIKYQLDWRGPGGRSQGQIVLDRRLAEALLTIPGAPAPPDADERDLLQWLSREDFSQYGECHGKTFDSLMAKGLVQIHGPGEHQTFIANDPTGTKGLMYRAVSLTEAGWAAVKTKGETS